MSFYLQTNIGSLDAANKYCIDWNTVGLFAFANNYTINVVDAFSFKIIQTLEHNKIPISKLKWSQANIYDNQLVKPILKLASADESGSISIWNTFESKLINELVESNNSTFSSLKLNDLNWKLLQNKKEVLLALYSTNKLVIWDPQFGIKLWTKNFTTTLSHLAIDPHIYGRVACYGKNHVELVLNCFDEKLKEKSCSSFSLLNKLTPDDSKYEDKNVSNIFNKYLHKGESSDNKQKSNSPNNQCLQFEFHALYANTLIVVYPREILFFNVVISQVVGGIQLDKNQSNFSQLYSSSQKDALFILHDSGSISIRCKEKNTNYELFSAQTKSIGSNFKKIKSNLDYSLCAQSDQVRLSKNVKIFGFAVCPTSETEVAVLLNDGRLLKFTVFNKPTIANKSDLIKSRKSTKDLFLFEVLDKEANLKIVQTKMINSIASRPFIPKVCPPLTKKNSKYWQPLLAVGCSTGNLVIYNILKNCTEKKINILTNSMAINGIEWISMFNIITWSYHSNSNMDTSNFGSLTETSQQLVRNDIYLTDLRTGESRKLREGQGEESPIVKIKLSILKQYLVILFKEQPFEIWDLKNFSLIKKISKKSPTIKILEWCIIDAKKPDPTTANSEASLNSMNTPHVNVNENFICIDNNGLMYSFTVENNTIKDGGKVLPEDGLLSHLTSLAIKKDLIIFGDVDGSLSVWNSKLKSSKMISANNKYGQIKKLKFAPGKENFLLLVLFIDCIRIFEIKTQELISTFKITSKNLEILDCDWCASDKLVISFTNGCVSVFDIFFKRSVDERKFLSSISLNKCSQPMADFLKNTLAIKRFYYQIADVIVDEKSKFEFQNLDETIRYYANKNEPLKDFLSCAHPNLKSLLARVSQQRLSKVNAFARLAMYLNLCQFEKQFWTHLAYYLNDSQNDQDQLFFDFIQSNDFLLNSVDFRQKQYETLKLLREKNAVQSPGHSDLLLCNELNLAFNLLTETDMNSPAYLNNSYKACLISSLQNGPVHTDSQTNIKLIATSLLVNGKVEEGIELLCLIGLVFDACRYLQDNDDWEKAAWLAKIRLPTDEFNEVIKRWTDHLCSPQINKIEFAILLLLNGKQYAKVLELLNTTVYSELNHFFLEICIENKLVTVGDEVAMPKIAAEETETNTSNSFNKSSNCISEKLAAKIVEDFNRKTFF